jgi:DNA-binding CsgD family transcriptional regulator
MTSALSDRDLVLMGDVLSAGIDAPAPGALPEQVLVGLSELVRCDSVSYAELDASLEVHHVLQSVEGGAAAAVDPDDAPFWAHYWQSPFCSFPSRTGDDRTVTMLSDFQTRREWLSSGMYAECFADDRIEHELMSCLPSRGTTSRRVIFFRGPGRDFDERDRMVMALLRPHLAELLERGRAFADEPPALTARQTELLRLVAQGRSTAQIAEALFLSPSTVRKHIENIFERLGVSNRTAAVMRVFGELPQPEAHG